MKQAFEKLYVKCERDLIVSGYGALMSTQHSSSIKNGEFIEQLTICEEHRSYMEFLRFQPNARNTMECLSYSTYISSEENSNTDRLQLILENTDGKKIPRLI